jgi:hypothetical protein
VIPVALGAVEVPSALQHVQWMKGNEDDLEALAIEVGTTVENAIGRQIARDEKKQEVRERVEKNAAEFIKQALDALRQRERTYRIVGYMWYGLGYLALIAGVGAAAWRATTAANARLGWSELVGFAVFGFVLIALLIAVAKYSFTLGKSFTMEALRNADRSHAISFGEFYLNVAGDQVEWKDVKDAFQHWNIDKGSSFAGQEAKQFDPQLLEAALEVAKLAAARAEKSK